MSAIIPAWAQEIAIVLARSLAAFISARTDEEREEALMLQAEQTKEIMDKRKFG